VPRLVRESGNEITPFSEEEEVLFRDLGADMYLSTIQDDDADGVAYLDPPNAGGIRCGVDNRGNVRLVGCCTPPMPVGRESSAQPLKRDAVLV
jgi:hypothetical protein